METVLVYSLILLFFILLCLFVVLVLSSHPYNTPQSSATAQQASSTIGDGATYGVIAGIFLLLCVVALLDKRTQNI